MTNWTEVNVYTGRPVDEDAPTNFAGAGSGVDMNPTGMRKKKKKLVDARTKSYKSHRAKLEAARVKREAKRNGVQEEVELDEALSPQDKKVVDAFYDGKPMNGKILSTNGKKLEKSGMGAQTIATSSGNLGSGKKTRPSFKIVAKMDGKSTQEIVRYIKKSFPTDVIESVNEADDFKPHMMYDPKTGKGYKANTMDDHLRMKKMGYDHEAPKKEEVERKTFSQKVIESISEFGVESLLAEDNVDVLRSIVKRKSAKPIKFKDGTMTIDMQTANMMLTVLDKVKPDNQRKLAKMMNGKKSEFMKVHGFVMKALGK